MALPLLSLLALQNGNHPLVMYPSNSLLVTRLILQGKTLSESSLMMQVASLEDRVSLANFVAKFYNYKN